MPRITIHADITTKDEMIGELYNGLFDVLHTAGISAGDGVVEHIRTDTKSYRPTRNKKVFFNYSEPFLELNCEYRHVPAILEAMAKLNVFKDLEMPRLNSLFILGRDIKSGGWKGALREKLLEKSVFARQLNIFSLRNLELFTSDISMHYATKKIILQVASDIADIDKIIPVHMLRKIAPESPKFRIDFQEALRDDLNQLAILAEIG